MRMMYRFLIITFFFNGVWILAYADDFDTAKAKSATCAACHGADGNSETNIAWPKLAEQHKQYLAKELLDYKAGSKGGRNNPVMTGIAMNLTDNDIAELSAYYQSLPRTIGAAQADLVAAGQRLYRGGDMKKGIPACSACHSPEGLGNGPAAFPLISGQNAAYISDQLKAFRAGTRTNDPNHMMRDIAAKMSDSDIEAVASYISGLH